MIGTTLSHYRITEKLGAGGMGVVYRAEDTNLNRQVAIKVLPEMFSGDPERMARFEREAKLLASLNHPNIATIYGLEQAEGKRFLAMELVEGQTLAQQIERGPLPIDEALEVCRQIAEGVEAAHEKGVIHRDLKPANVKITPEGKVKVLDFGLAKAFQGEMAAADASLSPTLTDRMTRPGVILGTAAYMAPEQAKGKAVDKRADIWAFGCVLYECLRGKRPFEGETATETLAMILRGEPDWNTFPTAIPWNVENLLRRCLQKDPRERIHDIADARIELKMSVMHSVEPSLTARRFSPLCIVVCTGVMLLTGILIDRLLKIILQSATPVSAVRSIIKVEPGHWLEGTRDAMQMQRPSRTAMAISSDGSFLVYSAIEENGGDLAKPQLYLRRMDQLNAKPIPGTENYRIQADGLKRIEPFALQVQDFVDEWLTRPWSEMGQTSSPEPPGRLEQWHRLLHADRVYAHYVFVQSCVSRPGRWQVAIDFDDFSGKKLPESLTVYFLVQEEKDHKFTMIDVSFTRQEGCPGKTEVKSDSPSLFENRIKKSP